ncbi:MAG: DUF58 domain-containing protein [bacterium]
MIPAEIIKKIRRIEIHTRKLVNDVFSGEYHSVFKGRGMEFSDIREYQHGDDIRTIDWNVTARLDRPFVKQFVEERELTVMLLVDGSASESFGTKGGMKCEIASEICALLAFSAIKNNDKVGLIIFTDRVEIFIPPRKGRQHVLRVIREILYYKPQRKATDINSCLEYLNKVIKRKTVTFLVSDFLTKGYEKLLRITNKKHDIIAVSIGDTRETFLPTSGFIDLEDAETGEKILIDCNDKDFIERYADLSLRMQAVRNNLFKSMNIDFIDIATDVPYTNSLISFFKRRAKRFH